MAIVTTSNRHYQNIANALRVRGAAGSFLPSQMAGAILNLEDTEIGDIVFSTEEKEEPEWLECDGQYVDYEDHPELWKRLRHAPNISWDVTLNDIPNPYELCYGNGYFVTIDEDGYIWTRTRDSDWVKNLNGLAYGHWKVCYNSFSQCFVTAKQSGGELYIAYDPTGEWEVVRGVLGTEDKSLCYFPATHRVYVAGINLNGGTVYLQELNLDGSSPELNVIEYWDARYYVRLFANKNNMFLLKGYYDFSLYAFTQELEEYELIPGVGATEITLDTLCVSERYVYFIRQDSSEYKIHKVRISDQTETIIDTNFGYGAKMKIVDDILFASNANKSYTCTDIDSGEFVEHENYAPVPNIVFDGSSYVSVGNIREYISSGAKSVPDINVQYGVKAYIRAEKPAREFVVLQEMEVEFGYNPASNVFATDYIQLEEYAPLRLGAEHKFIYDGEEYVFSAEFDDTDSVFWVGNEMPPYENVNWFGVQFSRDMRGVVVLGLSEGTHTVKLVREVP